MESENQRHLKLASKAPTPQLALLVATWMRTFVETCRMRENESLTEEKIETYMRLLARFDLESLEVGLRRASQECAWFPSVAEIVELIPKAGMERRAEETSRQLHARYKEAHLNGTIPVSPYRSILEPEAKKLLADGLNRQDRLRLGIDEPRQLSPEEFQSLVSALRDQASKLLESSGVRDQVSGLGAGLL